MNKSTAQINLTKGIKTSEFWVVCVGIGGLLWTFLQESCQFDQVKILAFGGVVISYVLGRTYLKANKNIQS